MKKRILIAALTLATVLLLGNAVYATVGTMRDISAYYNNIRLVIDGELITPKDANGNIVEPFIYNGTTYLPVRAVGEALGKEVSWEGSTHTVYIGGQVTDYSRPAKEVPLSELSYIEIGDSEGYTIAGSIIRINSRSQTTLRDGRSGFQNYVVYSLNSAATKFSAILNPPKYGSFDPELTYTIYGDGTRLYTISMTGDSAPVSVDLDVTGVQQFKIEVELVSRVWNSFDDAFYRGIENAVILTTDY